MRLTKARIQDLERVKKGVYQALDFVVKPNRRSNCDDLPVDLSRTSAFLVGTVVYFSMPVISRFLGIVIMMHYRDHAPPHFHASYGDGRPLLQS